MKKIIGLIAFLLLAACVAPAPHRSQGQLRLIRDHYGVAHIYADDIYGLYYGYGYAVAQDRLFQMEMTRRSTQGTVAEVLGAHYLDYDRATRNLFEPASIERQLDALTAKDKDIFAGFAAGMNAWLKEVRTHKDTLMPKQFIDNAFEPGDWTAYDVAMIFIGTMANRYGDFNTELDNLKIYRSLVALHGEVRAKKLFDLLNPRFTNDAPTTIPRADWSVPVADNRVTGTGRVEGMLERFTGYPAFTAPVTTGMSNCFVLGRNKVQGANSILVNGPQFGWFNPAYVYSVGLHGAGFDVVGNTPFAYPMIMFGHNRSIAWGSTWAAGDIVDLFAEQLNPENPDQYLYQGEYHNLEHRIETIQVRDAETVRLEVYRSVHGPIIYRDADAGLAYAKHRAWEGKALATLLAWIASTRASDYTGWESEVAKSLINVNMYFADMHGNIGYFFGGGYPQRVAGHDNRFPVSGDGSMDWRGRMSIDVANPHIENPASGYLANWNNKPGVGVMNPDFYFFSWSGADRVEVLQKLLDRKDRFTPAEAWSLIRTSAYADVYAQYLLPMIDAAVQARGDKRLQLANGILQTWDGQSSDLNHDGFYDGAATAIFRSFTGVLLKQVLADDLGDVYGPFSSVGYPTAAVPTGSGTNLQAGMKAVIESLSGHGEYDLLNGEPVVDVIIRSLTQALDQLATEQGGDIPALRLAVAARPFSNINFLGIPQAGRDELKVAPLEQNRGTENDMIVLRENAITGWEVTPPGQSAFISPDGRQGEHYDDQFEMYNSFGKKRMWFYARDVEADKVSEEIIRYVH